MNRIGWHIDYITNSVPSRRKRRYGASCTISIVIVAAALLYFGIRISI